ncbi:MAG: RHS repeat-associated core domain-containing protein, partial [Parachlamydiaceae bacterium]
KTASGIVTYSYDPFNRRLTANDTRFLYQGYNEIGSISSSHTALRVLGVGNGAENSAATLFELDSETYLPIHDHLGSLVRLIKDGKTLESHVYTAFGESNTPSLSPWRFSSKRLDPETNLIYFGRRYYNPSLMRWLTCDPKGYDGGPNLYAYCLNAPLSHIDLYGLVGIGTGFDSSWFFQKVSSFGRNLIRMPGLGLELIGQHFIPIPLVRDAVEYSGHVLAGRGLTTYTPSYSRNHSKEGSLMGAKDPRGCTHHMTNGICTSYKDFMKQVEQYQRENNGVEVHYVYNGSKGLVTDLLECGAQKLGIQTDSDRAFVKHINNSVQIYGPNNKMLVSAHSQG